MQEKNRFWIGQLLTIAATIVGVYLAAYTGFKTAVDFERVTNDRDMYYLLGSLHDELSDNVKDVNDLVALLKDPSYQYSPRTRPEFSRFIWETMRYSETTLQAPNAVLSQARRFHASVDRMLDKLDTRQTSRQRARDELARYAHAVNKETLPAIQAQRDAMRAELLDHKLISE